MSKKVFFSILFLIFVLGIGYATSFVSKNERLMGCFQNGMYYQPGQTWVGEKDGRRYRYICEEGGVVRMLEELAPLEK